MPKPKKLQATIRKPNAGTFRKGDGRPRPKGRKHGKKNWTTILYKEALEEACRCIGVDGKGKDGMVGWFVRLEKRDIKSFAYLVSKMMPLQLEVTRKTETYSPAEAVEQLKERGLPVPPSLMSLAGGTTSGPRPSLVIDNEDFEAELAGVGPYNEVNEDEPLDDAAEIISQRPDRAQAETQDADKGRTTKEESRCPASTKSTMACTTNANQPTHRNVDQRLYRKHFGGRYFMRSLLQDKRRPGVEAEGATDDGQVKAGYIMFPTLIYDERTNIHLASTRTRTSLQHDERILQEQAQPPDTVTAHGSSRREAVEARARTTHHAAMACGQCVEASNGTRRGSRTLGHREPPELRAPAASLRHASSTGHEHVPNMAKVYDAKDAYHGNAWRTAQDLDVPSKTCPRPRCKRPCLPPLVEAPFSLTRKGGRHPF